MAQTPLVSAILAVTTLAFLHILVKSGGGAGVEQGMAAVAVLVGAGVILKPLFQPLEGEEAEEDMDRSA